MSYTTTDLITSSYYGSGVVSREFETVSGAQIADGLIFLNNIITEKTVDDGMIPYEGEYKQNFVTGQTIYPIQNLIKIDTLVFFLNNVRFSMQYDKRNKFFGSSRAENIKSLPYQWYFERQFGGGNLHIYFQPDQNYPMEIHGVFRLPSVVLGQDLSLTLDEFYTTYLHYALIDRICAEYNYDTPPRALATLEKYRDWINKKSRLIDLRMTKQSTLGRRGTYGWAQINIGRGFEPT